MTGLLPFTGHNIRLADGTETKPGTPLIEGNGICQAALRMLDVCFPDRKEWPGSGVTARIADLGCLEGGYAIALAAAGHDVTGIEAREANYARCDYAGRHHDPGATISCGSLKFVRDDARNLPAYGEFDAVFCAGLLYHLDEPDAFLRMLGKVTTRLLILQTHFSLSPDTTHEGRRGHWQPDNPGDG